MNVQERLQLKRIPLDKWSNREQLCLAMAVLCSGDQNWMSVSRALKMMCGTNRPTDWFSQKFCAAQYGKLLENVETPKRKKRTATERDNPTADVTIIPGELIVRKLVQERTVELKKLVEEEQREYRQLAQDIRLLQSDTLDDEQVLAMWEQIESEKRETLKEQQKHAQWLREREEKKIEMERAWRPGAVVAAGMSPTSNSNSSGSPSRNSPSLFLKATGGVAVAAAPGQLTPKLEPVDQQAADVAVAPDTPLKQGTSPLLTSLLKSPSSTPSTPTANTSNTRALAPTITNLLTGGQPASGGGGGGVGPSTPAFIGASNIPNSGSSFFSFPSKHPQHQQASTVTTPSKAAPTLSKLLDPSRNKMGGGGGAAAVVDGQAVGAVTGTDDDAMINMDDDQQLLAVFKELMPDDLADILTDNNEMMNPELLDQDLENVPELMQPGTTAASGPQALAPVVEVKKQEEAVKVVEAVEDASKASKNDALGEEVAKDAAQEQDPQEEAQVIVVPVNEAQAEEQTEDDDMMELDDTVTPTVQDDDEEERERQKNIEAASQAEGEGGDGGDNLEEKLAALTDDGEKAEAAEESGIPGPEEEDDGEENEAAEQEVLDKETVSGDVSDNIAPAPEEDEPTPTEELPLVDLVESEPDEKGQDGSDSDQPRAQEDHRDAEEDNGELQMEVEPEASVVPLETLCQADDDSHPPKIEERKVSTDNEDQFEDAKSTVGDAGHPPEDLEMSVTMKEEPESQTQTEREGSKKNQSLSASDATHTPEFSDRISRSKRDMPRRNRSQTGSSAGIDEKLQTPGTDKRPPPLMMEDSGEETKSSSASNISLRARLKERDRSESPLVMDEDTSDMIIPRTRRRYSSTPVIDSVPSSPASGDDREYKNWKKVVLIAFNQFSTLHYKYSAVLVQQVPEEFKHIILRPMDMQTIKKNIETGVIRSTIEFQRDVLLMVQNAIMMNTRRDRDWTNLINEMMVEVDYWKRETEKNLNSRESDTAAGGGSRDGQGKVRNRKSMRITTAS